MNIPPGIRYLIPRLPRILFPFFSVYTISYVLQTYFDIQISRGILTFALISSFPATIGARVLWSDFCNARDAAARGAVLPPRPPGITFGGLVTVFRAIQNFKSGYLGDGFEELCIKLGSYTFNSKVFFENRIVTAEPEHIKAMLATQFDDFEKGPEIRWQLYPLLGTGVFAVDGDLWKFHRSMTRPFFSRDRISHFDIFDRHAEDALRQFKARQREGYPVDFQDMVARFTLDSATEFLFGNDARSLSAGLPYPHYAPTSAISTQASSHWATRFIHAFSEAQAITAYRSRFGPHWPLFEFWHDSIEKPMSIVREFVEPIVAEAVERKKKAAAGHNQERDTKDETLLENLVNSSDDPTLLRDEIMSLLVAGRDTTASTLTFTIYMLAEHPNALARLREEILDRLGSSRRPDYDDLRDMRYLRAVINETLRLYPVVPFNVRTSRKAALWPSTKPGGKPIYIPPNTRCPYTVLIMHRRKDLWGDDALEFDPERFLDERLQKYLVPNPFIFLPFNAGPRICLGQQFAYNEASFFLVRLLQTFSKITIARGAQPPGSLPPEEWSKGDGRKACEKIRPKAHLTMYVEGGLWVNMEEASTTELLESIGGENAL